MLTQSSLISCAQPVLSANTSDIQSLRRVTVDELLTVKELAEWLKVSRSWVYERTRRRGRDQLPHIKIGKYVRFEESAVREFLARQRQSS